MNEVAMMTLVRPFYLGFREPIVAFWNVYIGILYGLFTSHRAQRKLLSPFPGILYCFISSYDVVFIEHHHFNLAQNGLAFLVRSFHHLTATFYLTTRVQGIIVGVIIGFIGFLPWALYILKPKFARGGERSCSRPLVPSTSPISCFQSSCRKTDCLPLSLGHSSFRCVQRSARTPRPSAHLTPQISMFWFGWTSSASIHWIVPIIASGLWSIGAFYMFQAGMK